jgi:hypothetical protein
MELLLENIEQNNQISQQEFGQLADWLYGSVALTHKDNIGAFQKKEQTLDFLIAFLKDYYEGHIWESDELEGHFLDFLSKVQLQKEVLQIASGQVKLKDVQLAMSSFAVKTQYPVGMR